MAVEVLATVQQHPGRPIVLLIDTQGQRLRHRDELLGINVYMAHLAQCLEVARRAGHRIVSLVYGRAVSGGYITGGMMADSCHALVSAEISVMNLPAMARVTKIPQERLEELAESSPVFAPGAANYLAMGGLESLWARRRRGRVARGAASDLHARRARSNRCPSRSGRRTRRSHDGRAGVASRAPTMRSTDDDGRPRRHARVWLDPATWRSTLRAPLAARRTAALDAWVAAGRAVVARRRDDASPDACLAVALPLVAGRTAHRLLASTRVPSSASRRR